jgi:hypothetical protein
MTWTKSAIREARKTELAPLLGSRGYRLLPLDNGNYRLLPDPEHPSAPAGLVVKQNFWIWPDRQLDGNTIDFFIQVEGKTFHEAMRIITAGHDYDRSGQELREEHGNVPEILR